MNTETFTRISYIWIVPQLPTDKKEAANMTTWAQQQQQIMHV